MRNPFELVASLVMHLCQMRHIRFGVPIARISSLAIAGMVAALAFLGIVVGPSSWQVHNFSINASSCKQTRQQGGS